MQEIKDIVEKLIKWSNAYYEGHQEVSDAEYDALENYLKKLDPNNEYFKKNRESSASLYGVKRSHLYGFIGSVPKIHKVSESKMTGMYTISAKMDGTSMTVYFKDGKVLYALTRADGYEGFDITDKYSKIVEKYDIHIPEGFTGAIRGEVVMGNKHWEEFKKKHPDAAMQRNTGTGIINRKGCSEDLEYLDFVVYEMPATNIVDQDLLFRGQYTELGNLQALDFGYPIAPFITVRGGLYSDEALESLRDNWLKEWPLDGVVFNKFNGYARFKDIYEPDSLKEAYKFENESKETKVIGIEWTLQKSGRLTPVVIMNPVELSGATIRRATANNAEMVKTLGLDVGAWIEVERANEVIPYINKVIEPVEANLPTECPYCGKPLIWEGKHLVCNNSNCYEQERLNVYQFLRVCGENVKGAGDSIYDLLAKPTLEETLDFLRSTSFSKYTQNQQKLIGIIKGNILSKMTWSKLLASVDVDSLGDKALKKLAKEKDWLISYFSGELKEFPKCVGPALQEELSKERNRSRAKKLYLLLTLRMIQIHDDVIKEEHIPLQNARYYSITGSLEGFSRSQFEIMCKAKGWYMASVKKSECLVTNDTSSGSAKNIEAQRFGKTIYSQREFMERFLK